MKKTLIVIAISTIVAGCGEPSLTQEQQFDLKKLEMQQKHELLMKQVETKGVVISEGTTQEVAPTYVPASVPHSTEPVDNGSSLLGTVAAVGAGALAGYAVSGLLDNGYRSYSDNNGHTRYIDSSGKEISRTQFEDYRRKNPTQSKISDANQKAQELVKTGQQKTVQAAQTVKEKASPYVDKAVKKTSGVIKSVSPTKPSPTVSKPQPSSKPSSRPTSRR